MSPRAQLVWLCPSIYELAMPMATIRNLGDLLRQQPDKLKTSRVGRSVGGLPRQRRNNEKFKCSGYNCDATATRLRPRDLCVGYKYDSTSVRRPFDCLSKSKVTVT